MVGFPAVAQEETKRVLLLHSYRWGYSWSDLQADGLMSVFDQSELEIQVVLEQIDILGVRERQDDQAVLDHLNYRYPNLPFDLIVTTDTAALRFVAENHEKVFRGIPVVFSDADDLNEIPLPPDMRLTGVRESRAFQETLDLAFNLQPDASKIVVFANRADNQSGPRHAQTYLESSKQLVPVVFHYDETLERIGEIASRLSPDDIVIPLSYALDAQGQFRGYRKVRTLLNEVSGAPTFNFFESQPEDLSMFGGSVSDAFEQGRTAGEQALRILRGEDPRSIPIRDAPTRYMFSYPLMQKFGFEEEDLPRDSIIIGKPSTIFHDHKHEIIAVVIVGALLLIIIVGLLVALGRYRELQRALKESEERFRDFAEMGADWLWETDARHEYVYVSEAVDVVDDFEPSEIVGWKRGKWSEHDYDFISVSREEHMNDIENRQPFEDLEVRWERTVGHPLTLLVSGNPVYDASGEFVGYRGITRDITMVRDAAQRLMTAVKEAEEANRAKSEFMAMMSHEFRTPLNAIIGFTDMIRHQYFGKLGAKQYLEYADHIHDSGKHLLAFVNQILDIEAIEAGTISLEFEKHDIAELIDKAVTIQAPIAARKSIRLTPVVEENLPHATVDAQAIMQVLINLLSNACKFSHDGGEIQVRAVHRDNDVVISVVDKGIGIEKTKIKEMLSPFSKVASDPFQSYQGYGLGLSITKSLVDVHGGELVIESALGEGTTVTVVLPINGGEA